MECHISETSAKMGINTDDFLDKFIVDIYNNMDRDMVGININNKKLTKKKKQKNSTCCCCIS